MISKSGPGSPHIASRIAALHSGMSGWWHRYCRESRRGSRSGTIKYKGIIRILFSERTKKTAMRCAYERRWSRVLIAKEARTRTWEVISMCDSVVRTRSSAWHCATLSLAQPVYSHMYHDDRECTRGAQEGQSGFAGEESEL